MGSSQESKKLWGFKLHRSSLSLKKGQSATIKLCGTRLYFLLEQKGIHKGEHGPIIYTAMEALGVHSLWDADNHAKLKLHGWRATRSCVVVYGMLSSGT